MDGIGWILTVVISGLLLISVPIAVALGMGVLITMHFLSLPPIFFTPKLFGALDTFALVAIPFFILSGEIMQRGSMAKALLNVSRCMVGHVTGGLAHISVLTCLFYGALCGSGPATTAAVGGFMIPSMIKGGYPRVFSTAVSTVGGCLGVMIPPSVPLILYGASAGLSISNLFIAAIIPGIFVGALLIIVCYFICLFYYEKSNRSNDVNGNDRNHSCRMRKQCISKCRKQQRFRSIIFRRRQLRIGFR